MTESRVFAAAAPTDIITAATAHCCSHIYRQSGRASVVIRGESSLQFAVEFPFLARVQALHVYIIAVASEDEVGTRCATMSRTTAGITRETGLSRAASVREILGKNIHTEMPKPDVSDRRFVARACT